MFKLKLPERKERAIGLSQAGNCPRSIAYRHNGYPETPHPYLDPVKRLLSLEVGRALHDRVRSLIEGVRDMEREVFHEVLPGVVVRGHIDGLVPHPEEEGRLLLLEMKTMAPYGFERLVKGEEIDRAYLVQISLYLEALLPEGVNEALFVGLNKADGSLHTRIVPYDPALAEEGKRNLALALSLPPEKVPRAHAPDERGNLPWQCTYCAFWAHCWPQAEAREERGKAVLVVLEENAHTLLEPRDR